MKQVKEEGGGILSRGRSRLKEIGNLRSDFTSSSRFVLSALLPGPVLCRGLLGASCGPGRAACPPGGVWYPMASMAHLQPEAGANCPAPIPPLPLTGPSPGPATAPSCYLSPGYCRHCSHYRGPPAQRTLRKAHGLMWEDGHRVEVARQGLGSGDASAKHWFPGNQAQHGQVCSVQAKP